MRLDKCLRKPVQTKKKNTKKLSSSPAMKKQSEVHRRFATGLRKQTIELKYFWHFYGLLQKRLWHFVTKVVTQPCKTFLIEEMQVDFGGSNHLKELERRSMNFNIFPTSSKSHSSENILFLFTTTKCCQKPQSCQSFFEWSRILINLCDGARCI